MYSGIVSLLLICSAAFFISETRGWKAPKYSRVVISVISGVVIGLLMQHWLLDWSYFEEDFAFPTLLAVILLLMCSIPVESNEKNSIKKSILKKCLEV